MLSFILTGLLNQAQGWEKMDKMQNIRKKLDELQAADLIRKPITLESAAGASVASGGRELLCFSSNDYLGLANDPAVRAESRDALSKWGLGSGASRLICGTMEPHVQLERALAKFECCEAVAVTTTGWLANHAAIGALAGPGDLVLCDKLNHASIIDAIAACGARLRTYRHCDAEHLREILGKHRSQYRQCLITTDSLFSMDGDLAPLVEIAKLKRKYDAMLMIDEAHATGAWGKTGRGIAELLGVETDVDVTVGTLSKAIGALGGFVAGSAELIELIRNTARPYIYTTALPPAICAAACKSLEIIRDEPARREKLQASAKYLRETLAQAGLNTLNSTSQIIPVVIGSAAQAQAVSQELLACGFLIPAIRPPTVRPGSSRLRISISAKHTQANLTSLAKTLVGLLTG